MPNQSDIQEMEFLKLPKVDRNLMGFESFQNEFEKKVRKGEDDMLLKVLTQYLNRTPDIEDYKKCQMIYRSGIDWEYTFCYENFPLGYVKRSFETLSFNVTFTPNK